MSTCILSTLLNIFVRLFHFIQLFKTCVTKIESDFSQRSEAERQNLSNFKDHNCAPVVTDFKLITYFRNLFPSVDASRRCNISTDTLFNE